MICMVQVLVPSVKGSMLTIIILAFKIILCCAIRHPFFMQAPAFCIILGNKKTRYYAGLMW